MTRDIDLTDRVAVVTGGGDGIGGATSSSLAAAGATVVIADIDEALATARVGDITSTGGRAQMHVVDVRDADAVDQFTATVLAEHGAVDILVNNVGHYLRSTAFLQSDAAHWDALHATNFGHVLTCSRAFLPAMVAAGRGAIVNVSSVEGLRGYPPDPVYGAYKAAVAHFTRCLALEVAPYGVRVNAIAPDVTQTTQVDYEAMVPEDLRDRWPLWVPLGRVGQPDDNSDVVLFLVSDLSRFITGQVLPTDGGTVLAGGWFRTTKGRWTNRPRNP